MVMNNVRGSSNLLSTIWKFELGIILSLRKNSSVNNLTKYDTDLSLKMFILMSIK